MSQAIINRQTRSGRSFGQYALGALYNCARDENCRRRVREGVSGAANYLYNRASEYMSGRRREGRRRVVANRRRSGRAPPYVSSASGSANVTATRRTTGRRRKMAYRRGIGTMKRGSRRFRRSKKKFRRGFTGQLMRLLTTPQVTRVTTADSFASAGFGVRTFVGYVLNTNNDLNDMWNRRPVGWLQNQGGTNVLAGEPQQAVLTKWREKYILQNRANWDMDLIVYECIVRRHKSFDGAGGDSVDTTIKAMFVADHTDDENQDKNQPGFAGANDYLDQIYKDPGYTPYMSSHFCTVFRIIKTTKYKIAMNDYVHHYVRVGGKRWSGADLASASAGGNHTYLGGWTKVLLFSWVGGPVDNEVIGSSGKQSKARCDLFIQRERNQRFYFPLKAQLQYNISSSNSNADTLGSESTNRYSTASNLGNNIFRAFATSVTETVAGDDDVPQENAGDPPA